MGPETWPFKYWMAKFWPAEVEDDEEEGLYSWALLEVHEDEVQDEDAIHCM